MKKAFLSTLLMTIVMGLTYYFTEKGYPIDSLALFLLVSIALWVIDRW